MIGPANTCGGSGWVGYTGSDCLFQVFNSYSNGYSQTSIGGPTAPGQTITGTLSADPNNPNSQFLSYLVMAIPSNDTFFGTPTGQAVALFQGGMFNNGGGPIVIQVFGKELLDAGTEANNACGAASPNDAAFLCQTIPGVGIKTPGTPISQFTMFAASIVNGSNMFPPGQTNTFENINNAFANDGMTLIATIDISYQDTPEPASVALFGLGAEALVAARFRKHVWRRDRLHSARS